MSSLSAEVKEERNDSTPMALPGDHIMIKVQLIEKVALDIGLRFAIREGTLTIGGGYVVSLGSNLDTTQT